MAYTPPNLIAGDQIEIQNVKDRIDAFRTELNVEKLTNSNFVDRTLTEENIARPEVINQGGGVIEVRLESGGVKYYTKPVAALTVVEDDSLLNGGNKGDPKFSLPPPSTLASNSGTNTILHKMDLTARDEGNYDQMLAIPANGLTVMINRKAYVKVDWKSIQNNLLNQALGNSNDLTDDDSGMRQKNFLVMRNPDGVLSLMPNGKRTSGATYTQSVYALRDQEMFGWFVADGTTHPLGEYTFFVVGTIVKGSGAGSIYGTHIGLQGRTEMSVEWWYSA